MLKTLAIAVGALSLSASAFAQEDPGAVRPLIPVLESQRSDQQPAPAPAAEPDDDEKGGWNSVKRGFYTGLVIGGILGALMVIDCGHPECGPLFALAAGAGIGIGTAVDALVDRRRDVPAVAPPRRPERVPFSRGRRVAIAIHTRW